MLLVLEHIKSRYERAAIPNEIKLQKITLICILATLPISIFYALNYDARLYLSSLKIPEKYHSSSEIRDSFIFELSINCLDEICLHEFIKGKNLEEIAKISDRFFNMETISRKKQAAAISYFAGNKYRNPPLLYRASRYYLASSVKEFERALEVLNNRYIHDHGLSDYYRGLVWNSQANPGRDPEKALKLFNKARDAGIPAAGKILLNLKAQVEGEGSSRK
jgi:hypothetical protein